MVFSVPPKCAASRVHVQLEYIEAIVEHTPCTGKQTDSADWGLVPHLVQSLARHASSRCKAQLAQSRTVAKTATDHYDSDDCLWSNAK